MPDALVLRNFQSISKISLLLSFYYDKRTNYVSNGSHLSNHFIKFLQEHANRHFNNFNSNISVTEVTMICMEMEFSVT